MEDKGVFPDPVHPKDLRDFLLSRHNARDTDITADCLGSSSLEKPHALRNVRCSSAAESRVEWQTSRKKFLARNYSGGPGVTTESIADGDGYRRFLVSRRSDAL